MISLYKNTKKLEYSRLQYSDSCINVTVPEEVPSHIVWDLTNLAVDMHELALVLNAYKVQGHKISTLVLSYIPDARADRVFVVGNAFPLQVTADFINSLKFDEVIVCDPHSGVSIDLINNLKVKSQLSCFSDTIPSRCRTSDTIICSPDKGALSKSAEIAKYFDLDLIGANKVRDLETGRIIDTTIACLDTVKGRPVVICDDICDGGGTFIPLAQKLKQAGASEVSLYVTHGIFAKGLEVLKDGIDKIYVYNIVSNYITSFDIQKFNARNV